MKHQTSAQALHDPEGRKSLITKGLSVLVLAMSSLILPVSNAQAPGNITLPPLTINVQGSGSAYTRAKGQSEIRNIASTNPGVATARENGTNDVLITGKKPGVAVISFLDAATGTVYRVTVTVKEPPVKKPPTPPVNKNNPPKPVNDKRATVDKCMVGGWLSEPPEVEGLALSSLETGGGGIVLVIKGDGEVTVNYNAMMPEEVKAPVTGEVTSSRVVRGTAKGHVTVAKPGVVKVVSVEESKVTQERTVSGKTETTNLRGLGSVLGDTNLESNFSCGEGTLQLKHGPFIYKFNRL